MSNARDSDHSISDDTTSPASEEGLPDGDERSGSTARGNRFQAGPFIVVAILVTVFALIQVQRKILNRADRHENEQSTQADSENTVGLIIQWDSQRRMPMFEAPWSPGMTVRDAMLAAQRADLLTFQEEGEGDAAMLTAISGVENQGGATDSFNWTFQVNGVMADKSFGVFELQKGDIVSWKFGPYE